MKLVALPIQTIDIPGGLLLKRGSIELAISGKEAARAVRILLGETGHNRGATRSQIRNLFSRADREHVDDLIGKLLERKFLVPADTQVAFKASKESNLDIFLSNLGETTNHALEQLEDARISIIGVNPISRQLALSLTASGYKNFLVFDSPLHRNNHLFHNNSSLKRNEWPKPLRLPVSLDENQSGELGTCVVATSDSGDTKGLCRWNEECLQKKIRFFPVLLKDLIGYVGPLIVPGETPCFQCFVARFRSHASDSYIDGLLEAVVQSRQAVVGYHPTMATILGDIAAFEIMRSCTTAIPRREANQTLEVNLLAGRMTSRTILKVPRCTVCSPLRSSSVTNIKTLLFPEDTRGLDAKS